MSDPSYDDIQRRAYERFVERGGAHGSDMDDWLQAEQELRNAASPPEAQPPLPNRRRAKTGLAAPGTGGTDAHGTRGAASPLA